ncbi:glycosyltransferase [Domibacillus iocasae]|uniref:Glycosyl transferase family 1 n=1 Tax=Domibacillus iocasae TaxID=1714016 RepID=A0A1E7DQI1_9BACI|nr:glycosyltransferase [Domibacillus iocasae]OES44938.1 hypothetical protein BA724_06655 [Domibacillus iocasae]
MKVLIVPSWYPTEISSISGVFFQEQALALQENGLDITVAYPEIRSLKSFKKFQSKGGIHYELEKGLKTYRYRGYNYLPRMKGQIRKKFLEWFEVLFNKIVEEHGKPDIIQAHSILWGGWASAQVAKKYNIPLIITEHSSLFTRNLIADSQKKYIKEALDIADEIITVGPTLKEKISEYTAKKIIIIPNSVDMTKFYPEKINNKSGMFQFFSLAFLTPNKGMDILIKAFSKAFPDDDEVKLVIGGDGQERNRLEMLVKELEIESKVKFLGLLTRERTIHEMKKCNSFVLASKSETFGVVYIEALACGKPIISTRCGGPDMIVNENNGLLVDVDDIEELAAALKSMVRDYKSYSEQEIVEDCKNRFSEKAVSKQLISLFEMLI